MKIKEFTEGKRLNDQMMIGSISNGVTNKGAPYLSLMLQDNTGTMDAKYWNVTENELDMYKAGDVVVVNGTVIIHNGQMQVRITALNKVTDNIDMSQFLRTSKVSETELKEKIYAAIDKINDPVYKQIVNETMKEYDSDFFQYPAASKVHHNFMGGLATHVLGMLELAEFIADKYPMLDRDLLVSGVIIHDIGKTIELSGPVVTEYTLPGKLLGHISIMQARLYEISKRLGLDNSEEAILLMHMELSHHGQYEFGSPVLPEIAEAEVLNIIDNLDARMNILDKAFEHVKPGDWSGKLFAMDNRAFYKHK